MSEPTIVEELNNLLQSHSPIPKYPTNGPLSRRNVREHWRGKGISVTIVREPDNRAHPATDVVRFTVHTLTPRELMDTVIVARTPDDKLITSETLTRSDHNVTELWSVLRDLPTDDIKLKIQKVAV